MNLASFHSSSTVMGTGKYRDTPIGNIPLEYLLETRRWDITSIFRHEVTKTVVEIAIRRNEMNVSTRTIRAIEILDVLDKKSSTANEVHDVLYKKKVDKPSTAATKAILDVLCTNKVIRSTRGRNGGYELNGSLYDMSLYSINKLFYPTKTTHGIERTIRKKVAQAYKNISIYDILRENIWTLIIDKTEQSIA